MLNEYARVVCVQRVRHYGNYQFRNNSRAIRVPDVFFFFFTDRKVFFLSRNRRYSKRERIIIVIIFTITTRQAVFDCIIYDESISSRNPYRFNYRK